MSIFSAGAVEVRMAFGEKIPPFCIPETNSGIEIEVIGEALAYRGHVLKPLYFPFSRVPLAFMSGDVDAAMSSLGQDLTAYGAHYGDPAVVYDNVFFTLRERGLVIKKPQDLAGLKVISFNGADKRYPLWLAAVQEEGRLWTINDQSRQVLTLDLGRYDVVLSDRLIFKYFTAQVNREQKAENRTVMKPVVAHSFTKVNPMDYRPLFRDLAVRDDFNAGLKHLKATKRFKAIYDKYSQE